MFEIEYAEPEAAATCGCCGGTTQALTRMISRNMTAYGLCHVAVTETHPAKEFAMVISLGEWWIDDTSFRRCFSIGFGPNHDSLVIVEPEPALWSDTAHLGRMLTLSQALADPEFDVLSEILKQMAGEDPVLSLHLKKSPG